MIARQIISLLNIFDCVMLLTATALLISIMVTIYLFGCGGKDRSRTQAGAQEPPTVSKQLEAKAPKSAEHAPDPNAGPSVNRSVKSKVEDDGGYESCPDMTPSQLAKAAKLQD
ncbi:unnamed protein product [Cylicocyclus nassatus]|uniref:Uncharacterized protein n=1 Tax=Cylicocyclus nassatus TaxID=53992 RepID=A0AA36GEV8_CYLNA|nr:unnamed protein product [Cylicocyclus nassatus]